MRNQALSIICWLLVLCPAVVRGTGWPATVEQDSTFTDPNGAFRFTYPRDFEICTQGKLGSCIHTYIPICDEGATVCVVTPEGKFQGSNFGGASFQVRQISRNQMMTADVCVTPYPIPERAVPEFLVSAEHPAETINGIQFLRGFNGEGGMSHSRGTHVYRALHKEKCFELDVSETETEPHVSDPPMNTLTPAESKKLHQALDDILHSFHFLD